MQTGWLAAGDRRPALVSWGRRRELGREEAELGLGSERERERERERQSWDWGQGEREREKEGM